MKKISNASRNKQIIHFAKLISIWSYFSGFFFFLKKSTDKSTVMEENQSTEVYTVITHYIHRHILEKYCNTNGY